MPQSQSIFLRCHVITSIVMMRRGNAIALLSLRSLPVGIIAPPNPECFFVSRSYSASSSGIVACWLSSVITLLGRHRHQQKKVPPRESSGSRSRQALHSCVYRSRRALCFFVASFVCCHQSARLGRFKVLKVVCLAEWCGPSRRFKGYPGAWGHLCWSLGLKSRTTRLHCTFTKPVMIMLDFP